MNLLDEVKNIGGKKININIYKKLKLKKNPKIIGL